MQLLATAEQMREFDRTAITGLSIPGLLLMENAGLSFVNMLVAHTGSVTGKAVHILCGKGNNGGDGFVIARHLASRGANVEVTLLGRSNELKGDALVNFTAVRAIAAVRNSRIHLRSAGSSRDFKARAPAIVVDAIFGTGFAKKPTGVYARAIDWANRSGAFVAAVDIPSGVNGSTGEASDPAIRADLTVAMGLPKIGHYVSPGRELSGKVEIGDIGVPPSVFRPPASPVYRVFPEDIVLPQRPPTAHKYSVGKVFILGGSRNFTGAPSMAAMAALRSGAGAVVLGVPASIHAMLVRKLTEVILLPLPETGEGTVAPEAFDEIAVRCSWADVVAVGPGMGRNEATDGLVLRVLKEVERTIVLDADGLTALAGRPSATAKRKSATILTPHSGELARLIGSNAAAIESRRVEAARESAKKLRSIVVLKGSPTVTATPDGKACMNSTGNPGMATVGSGDVLTGIIAGLVAQGMGPEESAWGGALLHGAGGDIAAGRLGQNSLLASDILDSLPEALMQAAKGRR